jgi:hypothetical protein
MQSVEAMYAFNGFSPPPPPLQLPQSIVDKASLGFLFFAWFFLNVM